MRRGLANHVRWAFIDMVICAFSLVAVSYLRFEFRLPEDFLQEFWIYAASFITIIIGCNFMMDCYNRVFRYSGLNEAIHQMFSACIAVLLLLLIKLSGLYNFSGSIILLYGFVSAVLMVISRFYARIYNYAKGEIWKGDVKRVLIIGGGSAASLLIKRLYNESQPVKRKPIVVLDDDQNLWGTKINDVPIAGGDNVLPDMIQKYSINEVIIAIPSIPNQKKRSLYNICAKAQVPLLVFPCVVSMDSTDISSSVMLSHVNFEDLLGRGAVHIHEDQVKQGIEGKVVLVTGGAGSIGSEICRQVLSFGCRLLVLIDFNENGLFEIGNDLASRYDPARFVLRLVSIRDKTRMSSVFAIYKPDVVFHAAAHKHVPLMEVNPSEAVKNNIFGTLNVIECAYEHSVDKLVLISSDKAVNPANVMGATKRISEMLMQIYNGRNGTRMSCVRFGNVMGSNGSVIPLFKKQILDGGPVTLTHPDVTRYFMTIPEAVQLVLQADALSHGGEIFFLDMGEPVRIYDLACNLIRQAGLTPHQDIKIVITGLRPGEKLFEELQLDDENVKKTIHEMIFVCNSPPPHVDMLLPALDNLRDAATANENTLIKELIFRIVPDKHRYIPPTLVIPQGVPSPYYNGQEDIFASPLMEKTAHDRLCAVKS